MAGERHCAAPFRLLALGDSYTVGESVGESERWPVQLVYMLRQDGVEFELPTILAQTGWTTGELRDGINDARPTGVFDLVSLQIGVNNQYRGLDAHQFASEFSDLLELAVAFAGDEPLRVIVLSIPDWGVTPFAAGRDRVHIGREIDNFNRLKRLRTEQRGCHFVDVTPRSREAADDATLLADDGLHPSGKMYARWCELAFPAARLSLGGDAGDRLR